MKNKDVLYAKWLSGEISDEELQSALGVEAIGNLDLVVKTVDQWSTPKYDTSAGYEKFKEKHRNKSTPIRKLNWFKISGLAASFLVLLFVGNKFFINQNEELYAKNGHNEKKTLANGSEISLNDGSTITYNTQNWTSERVIELSGEAVFQVTKGSPFVVNTKNGVIRVLGTQFNVRAWGSNLYVECYEGKVEVTVNNQKTILIANEAVNVLQGNMDDKQIITNKTPSWQNGTSRFYNENLQIVLEELERQYDIKVNLKTMDRSFSGTFRHNDLENAIRNICKPLGLNFTISEDQKLVVIE